MYNTDLYVCETLANDEKVYYSTELDLCCMSPLKAQRAGPLFSVCIAVDTGGVIACTQLSTLIERVDSCFGATAFSKFTRFLRFRQQQQVLSARAFTVVLNEVS